MCESRIRSRDFADFGHLRGGAEGAAGFAVDGDGGDLVDDFHACDDFAEGGVLLVKVRAAVAAEADEEL